MEIIKFTGVEALNFIKNNLEHNKRYGIEFKSQIFPLVNGKDIIYSGGKIIIKRNNGFENVEELIFLENDLLLINEIKQCVTSLKF